jgi:hypothetical protein
LTNRIASRNDDATRAEVEKRATGGNTISGVIATMLLNSSKMATHSKAGTPITVVAIDFICGVVVIPPTEFSATPGVDRSLPSEGEQLARALVAEHAGSRRSADWQRLRRRRNDRPVKLTSLGARVQLIARPR